MQLTSVLVALATIAPALVLVVIAAIGLRKQSRTLIVVAAAGAIALFVAIIRMPPGIPQPLASILEFGIVIGALALGYVGLVQEPAWLAERLGFRHRLPEWEFDVALTGLINDFNDVLRRNREAPLPLERSGEHRVEAMALAGRLDRMTGPNSEWAALAQAYASLVEVRARDLGAPLSEEEMRDWEARTALTEREHERLRLAYREEAAALFRWP